MSAPSSADSAPQESSLPSAGTMVFPELDYAKMNTSHGSYQLTQIPQQIGFNQIPGGFTLAGGNESIFELTPKVFNLGRSILRYQVSPVAPGANNLYNVVFNDTLPEIRQLQFYTRTGLFMVDIQDVNNYLNMVLKPSTRLQDVITQDSNGYLWEGLQICQNTIGVAGGQVLSNTIVPPLSTFTIDKATTINYYISGGNNVQGPTYQRQFPLSIFKDTLLGIDRNLYFGGETVYMRIVWAPTAKIGYNVVNPAVSMVENGPFLAIPQSPNASNLYLYLAVEQNNEVAQALQAKVNSGGFNMLMPYVFENKLPLSGGSQTINLRYNRAHGQRLKKIWIAPYNIVEGNQTAYDHTNTLSATQGGNGSKINNFYTTINSVRTTQFNPVCGNYDDYMIIEKKLKGSCIQSAYDFYNNYFWLEDFTNNLSIGDKNPEEPEENQSDGISLDNELLYAYFAQTPNAAATTYNWYIFAVAQRVLNVAPGGLVSMS